MRMVDRVATASRVPAILADAGGAACIRHVKRPPRRAAAGATKRGRTRYSAMSADAFAGRVGAVPVACAGVAMSIFGGGDSCSTSLV